MAEPTTLAADPADRGTLDVETRAIRRIAERAALETPGTVAHHSTLGRIVGAGAPKASITMEGRRARIEVDVAAVWPCHVTEIATAVRDRLLSETPRMSGVPITTVDVTIHLLDPSEHPAERRVQ